MLHVNEENNDDLCRKAAEDFSLKAGKPDWQTFINKMNTGILPSINATVITKKKKNYRRRFFLSSGPPFSFAYSGSVYVPVKLKKRLILDIVQLR